MNLLLICFSQRGLGGYWRGALVRRNTVYTCRSEVNCVTGDINILPGNLSIKLDHVQIAEK